MKLDVLAIGAHPDDVELSCGGTLALLASRGASTGILHLTRGERGTRGTAEERLAEAERAAAALGAAELAFLDCGDGGLRTGEAEEDALIEVLRTWRPELVLAPPPRDRHPDHARAHLLVASASFYAGLANRGRGRAHRPAAVFCYMQHDVFQPTFIVDVSAAWDRKLDALAAYRSQLYQPAAGAARDAAQGCDGPPATVSGAGSRAIDPAASSSAAGAGSAPAEAALTKISTREFWLAVEGRARHFGQVIGAELGEPFLSLLPLAVGDILSVLPRGVR